ncbi:MAG: DUF2271 domain-containing protein [Bacteroidales bacterium]
MRATRIFFTCLAGLGILSAVHGQTAGTFTFSCTTTAPSGSWGNKHVLAVWIQNNAAPSVFIKTKAKYGNEDDHLTSWTAASGKNLVDAVTGATLSAYGTVSVSWNGTDVSKNVVMDGDYTLFIEMGWGKDKVGQHAVASFPFTKGAVSQHTTPAGTTNYSNAVIDWQPTATLLNTVEDENGLCIYPNPGDGLVQLRFQKRFSDLSISVFNPAGKLLLKESVGVQEAGTRSLDLSKYSPGLYLVSINSSTGTLNYRIVINK